MALAKTKVGNAVIEVNSGAYPVISLEGEINYESASAVRDAIRELVSNGNLCVGIQCRDASFVDSSGISALVTGSRELVERGGRLKLLEITHQLMHALEISGFLPLFDCHDSCFPLPCSTGTPGKASRMWQSTSFSIPASADSDGTIRRRVTELARSLPFTEDEIQDIQLATGEAVANAYRHGCKDRAKDRISVKCVADETYLMAEITSPGPVFDPESIPLPDPSNPRDGGMGIFFMRASMDSVEFLFSEAGTTVRMIKFVRNNGGGSIDPKIGCSI